MQQTRHHMFAVVCLIAAARAVPLSMVMNSPGIVIPNALDEELKDGNLDDDFTTHPLERLSSAATCLVAGIEYTHGQQIYRKDQCEFCLCLDGEMFCWWQDCPPTLEGPCKDRGPFTPCQNGVRQYAPAPPAPFSSKIVATSVLESSSSSATSQTLPATQSTGSMSSALETITPNSLDRTTEDALADDATDYATSTDASESDIERTTTDVPKICTIMGRQYNIGERLPHDTGNCVECICGRGAQITCSPHQCAPSGDDDVGDINDYRPPGLRAAQPDVF